MSEEKMESGFTDLAEIETTQMASLDIVSINKSGVFTKEQCEEILKHCIDELWLPTKVIGFGDLHQARRQKLRGDVQGFPFMDIRTVTKAANDTVYDFNLLGIIDQDFPQVFKYSENDYYNWHIEINSMAPSRKLSFIINLSDPTEHEGGNVEFLNIDTSAANISEQGSCLIFPSFMPFRITPVTKGTAHYIVGHIHGAIFK